MCKVHYDGCIVMNLSMDRANEGLGSEWGLQSDFDYIDLILFLLGLIYTGLWELWGRGYTF